MQAELPVRVVAADSDPLAAGLFLADERVLLPAAGDSAYDEALLRTVDRYAIDVLIPSHSVELLPIARLRNRNAKIASMTFLPSERLIHAYADKWETHVRISAMGLSAPRTALGFVPDVGESEPCIIKPRYGTGSHGVTRLAGLEAARWCAAHSDPTAFIVQEGLTGSELSVDVLSTDDGSVVATLVRERLRVRHGAAVAARVFPYEPATEAIRCLANEEQLSGLWNVQGFAADGAFLITDVNLHPAAGGLMLGVHAGINWPLLYVVARLNLPIQQGAAPATNDLTIIRYYTEVVLHGTTGVV
jgi:hypothetical protein